MAETKVYGRDLGTGVYTNDIGAPAVADQTGVLAATALAAGSTTTVTSGLTNPDVSRSLVIKGNQAGISGNVVITGTNYDNATISETIVASGASEVVGAKAFKTVTQVVLPARNGAGDTISVGLGNLLGLHQILSSANYILLGLLGRAVVAPTIAVSSTATDGNTIDLSGGTYNGSKRATVLIYTS